MSRRIFITTASWETRFVEGAGRVLETYRPSSIMYFWFEELADRTTEPRQKFTKMANGVSLTPVSLPMYASEGKRGCRTIPSYVTVWKRIREALNNARPTFDSFVLDITTMPRETLWITLDLLTDLGIEGVIVYHRAAKHGEWCGAEPERPHLVPKLGGLPSLELPTKLLIVSGYDEDRSEQFIASYEPNKTLILFQQFPKGINFENEEKSESRNQRRFGDRGKGITLSGINCYESDWGFEQIYPLATKFSENSNIIMASLGPKTSAVSLYRVHRHLTQSCLIYSACKNYNKNYSIGIGETLSLNWNPNKLIPA